MADEVEEKFTSMKLGPRQIPFYIHIDDGPLVKLNLEECTHHTLPHLLTHVCEEDVVHTKLCTEFLQPFC